MLDRAVRKKELIALGAMHRAELVLEREAIRAAAQPQVLGRSAAQYVAGRLFGAVQARTGLDLSRFDAATVLPLLATGASLLGDRTSLLKLLMRAGPAAALAAGAVALYRRRRKRGAGEHL